MIDKQLIKQKLLSSKEYLDNILMVKGKYTIDEFRDNFSLQLQMERAFEVINQIAIDVCTHILSSFSAIPANYANCFQILRERHVINESLSKDMIQSVRMRNLIVHQYAKIDYGILYNNLTQLQLDFTDFKNQILEWLSNYKY